MGSVGGALNTMGAAMGGGAIPGFENELDKLCQLYKLDERIKGQLAEELQKRPTTFADDIRRLTEILATARNPPGLLSVKLREMRDGTFGQYNGGGGGGGGGGMVEMCGDFRR